MKDRNSSLRSLVQENQKFDELRDQIWRGVATQLSVLLTRALHKSASPRLSARVGSTISRGPRPLDYGMVTS
jgi:hypothetical protein